MILPPCASLLWPSPVTMEQRSGSPQEAEKPRLADTHTVTLQDTPCRSPELWCFAPELVQNPSAKVVTLTGAPMQGRHWAGLQAEHPLGGTLPPLHPSLKLDFSTPKKQWLRLHLFRAQLCHETKQGMPDALGLSGEGKGDNA